MLLKTRLSEGKRPGNQLVSMRGIPHHQGELLEQREQASMIPAPAAACWCPLTRAR